MACLEKGIEGVGWKEIPYSWLVSLEKELY